MTGAAQQSGSNTTIPEEKKGDGKRTSRPPETFHNFGFSFKQKKFCGTCRGHNVKVRQNSVTLVLHFLLLLDGCRLFLNGGFITFRRRRTMRGSGGYRNAYRGGVRVLRLQPGVLQVVLQHLLTTDAEGFPCAFGATWVALEKVAWGAAAGAQLPPAPIAVGAVAEPAKRFPALLARLVIRRPALHGGRRVLNRGDRRLDVVGHILVGAQRV